MVQLKKSTGVSLAARNFPMHITMYMYIRRFMYTRRTKVKAYVTYVYYMLQLVDIFTFTRLT